MIWAHKLVETWEADSVELLFREQAAEFDHFDQMLLVSNDVERPMRRLWVGVFDFDLLTPYYGFTRCRNFELPRAPMFIAGDPQRFGQTFHRYS